jgi:hypothetical protein
MRLKAYQQSMEAAGRKTCGESADTGQTDTGRLAPFHFYANKQQVDGTPLPSLFPAA